eukprot:CAMPEP_0172166408 /NCGR_PEP_ID=MMETSP1050-20130122/8964_1 /TAXON_ID=233186 /ORGANISM="Cryptomonas curvata, Strain CCAP979/52" /LENGTH=144 /DNA_ID=CAMNT_0012837013 /DNA_START=67 /DNA_END=498 /DNA_ORIENTATION=-
MAAGNSFGFVLILTFIIYVPPCCDGNSLRQYSDPSHSISRSALPGEQDAYVWFRLRGGMPHLSRKKRKAPEDTADDVEKQQNDDSSGVLKSSDPDKKNANKDAVSPLDDSTVVVEGDDIPSDLHESELEEIGGKEEPAAPESDS